MEYNKDLAVCVCAQLEGLVVLMDLNSGCIFSNKKTANLFGFEREEALLGCNAFDVKCPAVEYADYFLKQDKDVRDAQKTFEYLDMHTYADQEAKIFLTKKIPFYHEGLLVGTICQCTEIRAESLRRITGELIKSDRAYHQLANDRSYVLNKPSAKLDLSDREFECLFYLLRGHSMKEIGKKVAISDRTVETYVERIKLKHGLKSKADLVDYALVNGLINYVPKHLLLGDFSVALG